MGWMAEDFSRQGSNSTTEEELPVTPNFSKNPERDRMGCIIEGWASANDQSFWLMIEYYWGFSMARPAFSSLIVPPEGRSLRIISYYLFCTGNKIITNNIFVIVGFDDTARLNNNRFQCFQLVTSILGIFIKHFDRIQGKFVQVFANQVYLLENIIGHCYDVATNLISLEDVQ